MRETTARPTLSCTLLAMPRVLICTEQGHQLPRVEMIAIPGAGDEISLVSPSGARKWFEVVRVAWTLLDPQATPDAFLATESQAKSEDAIVVVRAKTELPELAPYRMFGGR
jgi:hypothetical protein